MILSIADVLPPRDLSELRKLLQDAPLVDGRATAGKAAQLVKHNRQVSTSHPVYQKLSAIVVGAVGSSSTVQAAALPRSFRPPLISLCTTGMGYGRHIDDAVMGTPLSRVDLSYTLFLSDPDAYDGGELVLEDSQGEQSFKLPAGAMVLYPSTFIHRVDQVTRGERWVAAGWIQSLCRSALARETLFDLHLAIEYEYQQNGKSDQYDLLTKTRSNLLRLLVET